jgi:hypothetical protein
MGSLWCVTAAMAVAMSCAGADPLQPRPLLGTAKTLCALASTPRKAASLIRNSLARVSSIMRPIYFMDASTIFCGSLAWRTFWIVIMVLSPACSVMS